MLIAFKETLLQVFIAYLPAFACQIYMMRSTRIAKAHICISIFSVCSTLMCMLFSFYYFKQTAHPFDFRMIPYVIGILYGGYRLGGAIVLSYLLILYGFDYVQYPLPIWSDPLLYITPFIFLYMNRFRAAESRSRVYIVMNFALFGIALYVLFYAFALWDNDIAFRTSMTMFMTMFGVVYMLAACTIVYFIENVREKAYLQEGYVTIWREYRQEVQKLHQVLDTTPLGVFAVDANARVTNVNKSLLHIISIHNAVFEEREFIGMPYLDFFHQIKLWETDDYLLLRVLRGEPMQNGKCIIGSRTYMIYTNSMRNQETGEIVGAVGMIHDITELAQLRAEMGNMERLSLVGQMAASITHEIRNPMAVVRGFIQLMKEKNPSHMDDYYSIVMEELDRANGIINDFLSLAQNRIVEKEHLHLQDIINNIMPLILADANLRGQKLEVQLGKDVPQLLLNPKEMKQMVLNLARNAMEAMEEKGILTISTRYDEAASLVELRVNDTGMGIPDAIKDKLFEPFYTTKSKGTGLGLPLCLSIAERHQGTIRIESENGKGTTFVVKFKTCQEVEDQLANR